VSRQLLVFREHSHGRVPPPRSNLPSTACPDRAQPDEVDRRAPKADTPTRLLWAKEAELPVRVAVPTGFSTKKRSAEDRAKEVVAPLLKGMLELLKRDAALPGKKLLYAEMGYRGDWPDVMPASWNPVLDRIAAVGGSDAQLGEQ